MPIHATCAEAGFAVGPQSKVTHDGTCGVGDQEQAARRADGVGDAPPPVGRTGLAGLQDQRHLRLGRDRVEHLGDPARVPPVRVAHDQGPPVGELHLDLSSKPGHGRPLVATSEKRRPGRALRRPGPAPIVARVRYFSSRSSPRSSMAACAAASRAIGTRNGEQLT